MRIALLEMSFSARAVLPFVAELQKHAEVDCLVTEPQLLEHFRYYGVPCRLLDVDAEARVVAAMPWLQVRSEVASICAQFDLPNLREIFIASVCYRSKSLYRGYDEEDLFRRTLAVHRVFAGYLAERLPDVIVQNYGAELERRMLRMLGAARNITNVWLEYVPFVKGYQPSRNEFSDLYDVPLRAIDQAAVDSYIAEYRQGKATYHQQSFQQSTLRDRLRRFSRDPHRWSIVRQAIRSRVSQRFKRWRKTYIEQRLQSVSHGIPEGKRLIFFPMQTSEESTLTVRSRGLRDQIHIIEMLAVNMPDDCALLVKYHPHYLDVMNLGQARKVAQIKDVVLLPSTISAHDLIKKVDLVVTVNSTVGFEAVLLGKPVVLLGRAVYGGAGVTLEPKSVEEWPRVLAQGLQFKPDVALLHALIRRWLQRAFCGLTNDGTETMVADLLHFCREVKTREGGDPAGRG